MIAASIVNGRLPEDWDPISPFDFIAGFEQDPEVVEAEKLRKSIKHSVALVLSEIRGKTHDEVQAEKRRIIERLTESGVDDPEGLVREVCPDI